MRPKKFEDSCIIKIAVLVFFWLSKTFSQKQMHMEQLRTIVGKFKRASQHKYVLSEIHQYFLWELWTYTLF